MQIWTKELLKECLQNAGLTPSDTILIHSSMKSIGQVSGGADTVLDALQEYFCDGLVVFPTLTWRIGYSGTPEAGTVFSVRDSATDVGILAEMFRKRPGVIRSLHPSHSIAAFGLRAKEFTAGHEYVTTSLGWNSPWGRLYDWNAKILFIGTGIGCNTFLHAVEEKFPVPGLMENCIHSVTIIDANGKSIPVSMRRHVGEHSHQYHLVEDMLLKSGAARIVSFGAARCHLLDARQTADEVWSLLKKEPFFFTEEFHGIKEE